MEWMFLPLKRYAEFSGRSRRKEFWMFMLFEVVGYIVLGIIEGILGLNSLLGGLYGPLSALFALAMFIHGLAVEDRRLHDTARSGWWILIGIVPLIGAIVLLVFLCSNGTSGENRYGSDPKDPSLAHGGDVFA